MSVTISTTNKPLNPRAQDLSPKGYNRASLYSGKALDFDGVNDSVSVSGFTLDGYSAFSIAFYKLTDTSASRWIFGNSDSISDGLNIYQNSNGTIRARVNGLNFDTSNNHFKTNGLFVFTYNGATGSWIVNGEAESSLTQAAQTLSITSSSTIGVPSYTTGSYWDGQLTNFRIYNTALTAGQVSDLYNNPEKIVPDGVADSALKLWLPMMEGAGTTAYDGSGNGNHGTISGATWVSGVGAPVAQTALVGWNKGTNKLPNSNRFPEETLNFAYTNSGETEATITAPDGSTDAFEYICDAVTTDNQFVRINPNTTYTSGQVYTYSLFVKYNTKQFVKLAYMNYAGNNYFVAAFDLINGTITDTNSAGTAANTNSFIEEAPNGWYRIGISASLTSSAGNAMNFEFNVIPSGTPTWSTYGRVVQTTTTSDKVYIYGASLIEGEQGPYVHTIGTAQTSPVLLPQGLTANKDITGVNSVSRNAYALNLDGASWAEVHDNASLDMTTGVSVEAWIYNSQDGSTSKGLLGSWIASATESYLLFKINDGQARFYVGISNAVYNITSNSILTSGWNHIVGNYDGANLKIYINGSLDKTQIQTGTLDTSTGVLEIGRYGASTATSLADQLALPRIYNRALTATEVARNYNADKSKFGL